MNLPSSSRPHLFGVLAGLALAAGLVFAGAWTRISESQVINVTGSAHKNVRSDLVVWHSGFSVEAPTLIEAQEKLRSDCAKVAAFFTTRGTAGFATSPVQINPLYSSSTSWQGNNDSASLDKTITATISATFAMK
ncbi:MAG TPA: SIMPL domain-containing protein [Lacunisphaera sp.]|nr:SIMPL domain-containing protein [Lacunisphaera sp.]